MSGEPKDLARGTSTIAEEAVDQLQENEKLVAGESSFNTESILSFYPGSAENGQNLLIQRKSIMPLRMI